MYSSTISTVVTLNSTLAGLLNSTLVTSLAPVTITANTADNLSGVVAGEYYVDTDPGVGKGTPLNYSNGQLSTSATLSGLSLGNHTLYVRAEDAAGNWSVVASVQFTFVI